VASPLVAAVGAITLLVGLLPALAGAQTTAAPARLRAKPASPASAKPDPPDLTKIPVAGPLVASPGDGAPVPGHRPNVRPSPQTRQQRAAAKASVNALRMLSAASVPAALRSRPGVPGHWVPSNAAPPQLFGATGVPNFGRVAAAAGTDLTVTARDSATLAPLPGVDVTIWVDCTGCDDELVRASVTDSAGKATFASLPAGYASARFEDHRAHHVVAYQDAELDGTTPVNLVADLVLGGSVSGHVLDDAGGDPLVGVCVSLYRADGGWTGAGGCTGVDGSFQTTGVASGSYLAEFDDAVGGHLGEWWDDARTYNTAAPIAVSLGAATMANASLTMGGSVTGTVTDAVSQTPLAGAYVDVSSPDGQSWYGSAQAEADGSYRVSGLPAGPVVVQFWEQDHLTQWWDRATTLTAATPISVSLRQTTPGVNAALLRGATIRGTITDAADAVPLPQACVTVYDATGQEAAFDCGRPHGTYTIGGLAPGTYRIGFEADRYLGEFYADQPSLETATPVALSGEGSDATADASLRRAPSISGTVVNSVSGAPLEDVCVKWQNAAVPQLTARLAAGATTCFSVRARDAAGNVS
jgi:hypothetical protein